MTVLDIGLWVLWAVVLSAAAVLGYFVFATRRIAARAEAAVPPSGQFVRVGEDSIHYMEAGHGRPILFIHGLGGQLHHFAGTLFSRLQDDYRVIALDRPGSGYSVRKNSSRGGIDEQAATLAAFIREQRIQRPLVVGHSLGGAIALALALDHPELVSGLVLISPLTHTPDAIPLEFKPMYVPSPTKRWLLSQTVAVPASLKYAPQTLDFVFGPQRMTPDYPTTGGGMAGLRPSHYYATTTDFVAIGPSLPPYEARYEEIRMPVALMFGTADRVLDHRLNGLAMAARVPHIEIEMLDGFGHMLQFVATDEVEDVIRRMAARAFA